MRVLLSGASGFIGQALLAHFTSKKYEVVPLLYEINSTGRYLWRAKWGSLENFDALIHLAGEPISLGRWSEEKMEAILFSRKEGTRALCDLLANLQYPPPIFISASAIGYYGDRGEELLDEGSPPGKSFLARVCKEWEIASQSTDPRRKRTVQARFGLVLHANGGVLQKIFPIYRFGLGAKLSKGEQWVSWVALYDLVAALDFILHNDTLSGPVNIVSPHALRQKEFHWTLARLIRRPAFLRLPAWFLRLCFGNMADEILLASARVMPQKLCAAGFHFRYPEFCSFETY